MRLALAAFFSLFFVAAAARADPVAAVRERLAAGLKAYDAQDYAKAIALLGKVTRDTAAPRSLRARAYEGLGMALLIVNKTGPAREAFEDLLAIDPGYRLNDPSHSPKVRDFFQSVRAGFVPGYAKNTAEAELDHAAPTGATAGRPIEFEAAVVAGARAVAMVVLHSRRQGLLGFRADPLTGDGGRWHGQVTPPGEIADYTFEYYIEGLDGSNRVVARIGGPSAPLALAVKGAPQTIPWYRRWWVWGAAAAVVVVGGALGIGIGVGASANHAPEGSLPPGHVTLGIRF
jgi:hypothetical protein